MRHVDIVFCIDVTHSMHTHIERIKSAAIALPQQISMAFQEINLAFGKTTNVVLRVRVIAFRDYNVDSVPMKSTPFFILPAEHHAFEAYISRLRAEGGQEVTSNHLDAPSSGLEALALAIQSNWTRDGVKQYHVIVVWTDATAHPLEKNGQPASYLSDIPSNFDDLTDLWSGWVSTSNAEAVMVLCVPEGSPWSDIATFWQQTYLYPSTAEEMFSNNYVGLLLAILTNTRDL